MASLRIEEAAMMRMLVAGHLCLDITPTLPAGITVLPGTLMEIGPITLTLGGCVGNTGGTLASLGVPVRLAGVVADDKLGAVVQSRMSQAGLPTEELTVISPGTTSYSLVLQPGRADRTLWHHPGVNDLFDGAGLELDAIDLLHVGYPPVLPALVDDDGSALVRLFRRARAAGITTSLDMSVVDRSSPMGEVNWDSFLRVVLPVTDVFTPSFDDLASALGIGEPVSPHLLMALAERCLADGVAIVTLSSGSGGLLLATASAKRFASGGRVLASLRSDWFDRRLRRSARTIRTLVTTNGAGDAATAGILFALGEARSPEEALRIAVDTAAVTIAGGVPSRSVLLESAQG